MQNRSTDVALCSRCLYVWSIPFVQLDSLTANADPVLRKLQQLPLNLKQYLSLVKAFIDSWILKTEDVSERQLYEGKIEELLLVSKFGSNVSTKIKYTYIYIFFKFCRLISLFRSFLQLRKDMWSSFPGHLPRPSSLVSLWSGQLIKFREQKLLYNRKWSLGLSFFQNSCCQSLDLFWTTMKG